MRGLAGLRAGGLRAGGLRESGLRAGRLKEGGLGGAVSALEDGPNQGSGRRCCNHDDDEGHPQCQQESGY